VLAVDGRSLIRFYLLLAAFFGLLRPRRRRSPDSRPRRGACGAR